MRGYLHRFSASIKSLCERKFLGRPAGIWFVIAVLGSWTMSKLCDVYLLVQGEAGINTLISLLMIVPVNLVCMKGLVTYSRSIYHFTTYWLWLAYMVAVCLLPQYVHHDERWETFLLMSFVMSPVIISWFILKSRSMKEFYENV